MRRLCRHSSNTSTRQEERERFVRDVDTRLWSRRWIFVAVLICFSFVVAGCGVRRSAAQTNGTEVVPDAVVSASADAVPAVQQAKIPVPAPVVQTSNADNVVSSITAVDEPLAAAVAEVVERQAPQPSETPLPLNETTNVLVLGSDRRPNTPNWRTDVIMIVAMDLNSGEAGVISIPRDVYIDEIPEHRPNRINVIDYLGEQDEPDGGGPALLAGIIEEKMGIHIDHYLRFDFEGFKDVVDALGGVEVSVDCPVSDYLPEEDIALRLQPGVHVLDGRQALAYVRTRRQGGDLERARRQQRMVWAVRDQIRRENLMTRVPALYTALNESVQTDISLVAAIRYVRFALALDAEDVHGIVLGPPDTMREGWRGGMFVFVADWELISSQVQTIFERPPFVESNTKGIGSSTNRCP